MLAVVAFVAGLAWGALAAVLLMIMTPRSSTRSASTADPRRGTPDERLHRLLCSLFDADHLRRWLALGPEGQRVVEGLPGPAMPLAALAYEALVLLRRHGLLGAAFFTRLGAEFPSRRGEIEHIGRSAN